MSDLATLRSQSRVLFNELDASDTQVGNDLLTSFANIWQRHLAALIEWPKASTTDTTVLNQAEYTVPTDMLSISKVLLTINSKETELKPTSLQELSIIYGRTWKSDDAGTPEHYWFSDSNKYSLQPKPNSTNASQIIRIYYTIVPAALSLDGDTPDLPTVFHDTAQFFMASMAFSKIGKQADATKMMELYQGLVRQLKSQNTKLSQELNEFRWALEPD